MNEKLLSYKECYEAVLDSCECYDINLMDIWPHIAQLQAKLDRAAATLLEARLYFGSLTPRSGDEKASFAMINKMVCTLAEIENEINTAKGE